MMEVTWLMLLLPLAAGSGWIAAKLSSKQKTALAKKELPAAYYKGLNLLLNEEHDKAIDILVKALEEDSETVEVQLALGNLFRRRGEIARATRIHQNLIARETLDASQRSQGLFELGQDYFKAGLLDRAEGLFMELSETSDHGDNANRSLLLIYDQEKEWENAIQVAKRIVDSDDVTVNLLIAQYHCEIAESAIREGRYDAAKIHVKNAVNVDNSCVRARIQSGRLSALNGDHRVAIETWKGIEDQNPGYLGDVMDLIATSYRTLGGYPEYRNYLEHALKRTADVRIMFSLLEVVDELEGSLKAESFLVGWLRTHPTIYGLYRLIELKIKQKPSDQEDLLLLESMIGSLLKKDSAYICRQCGFAGKTLHWQCPGCKSWNSILSTQHQTTLQKYAISGYRHIKHV